MKILINYATVSGNSAMLSQQVHDQLKAKHPEIEFVYKDADDCKGEDYLGYDLVIFTSSSWDEGEMNLVAEEYLNQLQGIQGKKFALIGLGDSSYEHFCGGVDKVATKLKELGAQIVGEIHKIDGFIEDAIVTGAVTWAEGVISGLGGTAAVIAPTFTPTPVPTPTPTIAVTSTAPTAPVVPVAQPTSG